MEYLNKDELKRVLSVAYKHNQTHHLAMLVSFWHGLRVSEVVSIQGADVSDGLLSVKRLKRSKQTIQPLHIDKDPILDESPLVSLAKSNNGQIFTFTRQWADRFFKKYANEAGLHPKKAHFHVMKHSIAMALFDECHSLGNVQSYLGHKAASSTLAYLYESDASKAHKIVKGMKI